MLNNLCLAFYLRVSSSFNERPQKNLAILLKKDFVFLEYLD